MYECYECGVDRGGSGMREDGNCIDCGPVTKKKLKRRVEELIEAHDRLAAESAELRKEHDAMWTRVDRHRDEIDVPSLCAEVDDLILGLAAANATLDALREVVPEGAVGWCYKCDMPVNVFHYGGSGNPQCAKCKSPQTDSLSDTMEEHITKLQSILNPQPAALAEEKKP